MILMNIKKKMKSLVLLAMPLLFMGCALSPQSIDLHVQKPYQITAQGQQKALSLSVLDVREDNVLGTRGGTYAESSKVSISNDIEQVTAQAFSFSLHQAGFKLSDTQPDAAKLVVSITDFEYEVLKTGIFEKTIKISIQVQAQLSDEFGESTRVIDSWAQWQRFNYPSDEKNQEYVLEVFNDVLKQLIEDKELNQLLQAL
jgi:uncharacterized lipoprotein